VLNARDDARVSSASWTNLILPCSRDEETRTPRRGDQRPRDLFVKPVEIREVRHVSLDTNGAAPNRTCGVRDLGPASSSDEESYTLSGQLVRCGKSNPFDAPVMRATFPFSEFLIQADRELHRARQQTSLRRSIGRSLEASANDERTFATSVL